MMIKVISRADVDCTLMSSVARLLSGIVSVGLNALELLRTTTAAVASDVQRETRVPP